MSNPALLADEDFLADCLAASRPYVPETARCAGCREEFLADETIEVNGVRYCFGCYETTCDECGRETTVDDDHLCYVCARPELHGGRA
jgi:hypothetical protein